MDSLRRYGIGGEEGIFVEDTRRCIQAIYDSARIKLITLQCSRNRGHGPDGLYCENHAPINAPET